MAKAAVEKGVAKIVWKRSPDAVLVELERTPGINGRKKTHRLPRQRRELHRQDAVRDGVRLPLRDQGERRGGQHASRRAVTANVDLPALHRPCGAAPSVHAPARPRLGGASGASYYNVQLYPQGVKVHDLLAEGADCCRIGKTRWRYAGECAAARAR